MVVTTHKKFYVGVRNKTNHGNMRTQAREFCSFVHETLGKKKQGEIYNKSKNRKVNLMSIKRSVNFLVFSQLRKSYYIVVVLRDFPKITNGPYMKMSKT